MKKLNFLDKEFKKKIEFALSHLDNSINLLYELATIDEKTKLYNFRFFKNVLSIEIEQAKRGRPLSVLIADIDFFKKINDKYGHVIGDKILIGVAKVLKDCLRKADVIARYGGEEFVVMLPNTQLNRAKKVAERLRKSIEQDKFLSKYKVTISIGLCEFEKKDNFNKIINKADKALYSAKNSGRNCVCFG
jgi:diguanylate cyclase (GGDEF)-like protein